MPIGFLTDAERDRLNRFPVDIAPTDLLAYFTLSETDLEFIQTHRGDHNRLGYSLQLVALRLLGFAPDDLSTAPRRAVAYVALQLGVSTSALAEYGDRIHTRTDHLREIQAFVGFRDAQPADFDALLAWLAERAMEHDRPLALLHMSCDWLRQEKIVRPGVTRLERVVARAREMAQTETFQRMEPLLTPEVRDKLDAVLVPDPSTGRTRLAWLQREATAITPSAILFEIGKLTALRTIGAPSWNLDALAPNRRRLLSRIGQRATNQALQRMPPERRYPILLAFLHQAFDDTTDEVIDLFDRCLATAYARAGRELEEFPRSMARSTNEKVLLFRELGRLVLDATVTDDQLRAQIYQKVSPDELEVAVAEADRIVRPLDDNYYDLLAQRYSYLRQCVPAFLAAFAFRSAPAGQGLLDAIALLRQLDRTGRRRVPDNVPIDFVPPKWKRYVFDDQDRIDRRYYELSALWELRAALRAGDVWLDYGRRYADPETYLIPRDRWPELRPKALRLTGLPEIGAERLAQRGAELNGVLDRLDRGLPSNDQLRLVGEDLTISPVKGEDLPESAEQLHEQVAERLPKLELTDLLIEVDAWTGFTRRFEHAGGAEPRTKDLLTHLHAVIFANACNFGLGQMADIAELSYRKLAWCATWYLREDTLKAAIAQIVNYQHRLALAQFWGGGTLSSSDGQRFPVPVKSRHSTALPRYFGFRRGITHYTWTSDQYSPYGTKVIPSTVRDATYALDEILDNETELPIEEHTTDTAGYSVIWTIPLPSAARNCCAVYSGGGIPLR